MLAESDRRETGGTVCPDCVITVLPDGRADLGPAEHRALRVLAEAGLIGHRNDTSPWFTTRIQIPSVKTGPSVGEAVETALAVH
jgi:hypothetical protein